MRLLFIVPVARGGTHQYSHHLANALSRRGHSVAMATGVDFEMKPYSPEYRPLETFDRFLPRPLRLLKLLTFVRTFRPEIVHFVGAQQPLPNIALATLLRVFTRAPFVFTPMDVLPNVHRHFDRHLLRLLYRLMHHVFLIAHQNESEVTSTFNVDRGRITVIPLADLTAFVRERVKARYPDVGKDRKVILCFGFIEPRKGIGTLLDAFSTVRDTIPEAYLIIAGKSNVDIRDYQDRIATLGIENAVDLVPRYVSFEEMSGFFYRAELIVLPYHTSWNSGVVLSAFGFCKPVVATTVGSFPEVISDGETGLLVKPKCPVSLARALIRLLKDHALTEHMRAKIREEAKAHSWEEIAAQTEHVYAQSWSGRS